MFYKYLKKRYDYKRQQKHIASRMVIHAITNKMKYFRPDLVVLLNDNTQQDDFHGLPNNQKKGIIERENTFATKFKIILLTKALTYGCG